MQKRHIIGSNSIYKREVNTMKTKKLSKKLVLNKKTIAYLDIGEMIVLKGKGRICATGGFEIQTCITADLPTLCDTCLSNWPGSPICC
jgi:hypothetical protein